MVHPTGMKLNSDVFYADLARFLAGSMKTAFGDNAGISDGCFAHTAITLAAYLEDKICGLNLWNSFLSLYRRDFKLEFPFYDVSDEELLPDEPNLPEVRFLLWRGLNQADPATLVNPLNPFIEQLAPLVFQTLCEAYEKAPESTELKDAVVAMATGKDPLEVRSVCGWIAMRAYLTSVMRPDDAMQPVIDMINRLPQRQMTDSHRAYLLTSYMSVMLAVGPLRLPPYKWLAEMLRLTDAGAYADAIGRLDSMRTRPVLPYLVTSNQDGVAMLRSVNDEELTLSDSTMHDLDFNLLEAGKTIVAALMYFDGDWHINGFNVIMQDTIDFLADIELMAKNKEDAANAYRTLLQLNGGALIGVAPDWVEVKRRLDLDRVQKPDDEIPRPILTGKEFLYFINPDGNVTLLPEGARLVKLPYNPYYSVEEATRRSCSLIFDRQTTPAMRRYLLDNGLLPDARLAGPLPDDVAKLWFATAAPFLETCLNSDTLSCENPMNG